jgi:hypothetical protein
MSCRGPKWALPLPLALASLLAHAAEAPSPAQAFVQALGSAASTAEQRAEAWKKLTEDGKQPPKAVANAVDDARERVWRKLGELFVSLYSKKPVSGLRTAIPPHQSKVRDVVGGGGFGKEKLDEAMAPIEKALDAATAALQESEKLKPLRSYLGEAEGYAVGCGLRIGWNDELGDVQVKLAFVNHYAGSVRWRQLIETNRKTGCSIDPAEDALITRLNIHRILIGLAPVEIDLRLAVAGKKHSEEMAAKGYFAHDSPTPELKTPWQRAGREHTAPNGECIAAGSESGVATFMQWYYSQGHHQIMISGASSIGVGRRKSTWTLMMGSPKPGGPNATKMAQYVRKRYEAGEDAAKLFDLAKWCAAAPTQLLTQAQDELERVLALDPKNEQAQKALDRMRGKKK